MFSKIQISEYSILNIEKEEFRINDNQFNVAKFAARFMFDHGMEENVFQFGEQVCEAISDWFDEYIFKEKFNGKFFPQPSHNNLVLYLEELLEMA